MAIDSADLKHIPTRPGVYLFRDAGGDTLYVGKAKSLRPRVRSYFRGNGSHSLKTNELVRRVEAVETIVVGSEAEALILEANLIREHQPRFNLQLRDDKRYPYIKVTLQEPFPRILITRRLKNDGARYFGPFTSVGPMRTALDVIKRLYTVRSCRYALPKEAPSRPCLDHQIGRCKAPCVGLQSREDYRAMIDEILRILGGETEEIRRLVEARMHEAAAARQFEEAARQRDALRGLDALAREQRVQRVGGGDFDVIGLARDGENAAAVVLRIRGGLLLGRENRRFSDIGDESEEALLTSFATSFYLGRGELGLSDLPREVMLPADFEDRTLLEGVLTDAAGRRVALNIPQRGEKVRLVELAGQNARHLLEAGITELVASGNRADELLYGLQDKLDLKVVPRLIVCFDISHHQGTETVGSAVVFEHGEPKKSEYRHMKIQGSWGNDDVRSMEEVVMRYFRRRIDEDRPLPDLVVIDGGKGQLEAARRSLETLGTAETAVIALAKREEEIFFPGRKESLRLSRRDGALHLLQRLRDEAHRFAITYNRKLRKKRTIRSELADIPGIGPARQKALLTRFGSVRDIRTAPPEEISRVPGLNETLAHRIRAYLSR